MSNGASSSSTIARQTFELANDVIELDARSDAVFSYDEAQQAAIRNAAPWKDECVAMMARKLLCEQRSGLTSVV